MNDDGLLAMEVAITRGLETDDDRIDKFSKVAKIIIEQMEPVRYNYDNTTRYMAILILIINQIIYHKWYNTTTCILSIVYSVRDSFITSPEMPRKIDFRELLFREGMQV